jgi:hypothetical protein
MIRKFFAFACVLAFCFALACAEDEYKVTQETQEQSESDPEMSSPGTMVVE